MNTRKIKAVAKGRTDSKGSVSRRTVPSRFAMDEVLWAAWLYYENGFKQDQIAEELGISRASVFNLLQKAREDGVVNIAIDPTRLNKMEVAQRLCESTGLDECYILSKTSAAAPLGEQIGHLGARVLEARLGESDTIGVAWGRTVLSLSRRLIQAHLPGITVAQTTGSSTATYEFSPVLCTSNIAAKLSARAVNLHAPGVVSSPHVKDILMAEPVICGHFALLRQCDKTLFGVTQLTGSTLLVQAGFMSQDEIESYINLGAVGFASGHFFNRDGDIICSEFDGRHITMPAEDLRNVSERICVGGGPEKVEAIQGMLRARLCNILVTDEATAFALYDQR